MPAALDISGQRYGRLTALKWMGRHDPSGARLWSCLCDCGAITEARVDNMRNGHTRSCGCDQGKRLVHGLSGDPLYGTWKAMHRRCAPHAHCRDRYWSRGIRVWWGWWGQEGLAHFVGYINEHLGPRPSDAHSLDRIDNDRGYEPGNVRWALPIVQQRHARKLTDEQADEIRSSKERTAVLAERYGVQRWVVSGIRRGKTYRIPLADCEGTGRAEDNRR